MAGSVLTLAAPRVVPAALVAGLGLPGGCASLAVRPPVAGKNRRWMTLRSAR